MEDNLRRMVYLCGPIDAAHDQGMVWREQAASRLLSYKVSSFDPFRAYWGGPNLVAPEAVAAIDLLAVVECSGLLARVEKEIPTAGTYVEIAWAVWSGKPVVLWADSEEAIPLFIRGLLRRPLWLADLDAACRAISKLIGATGPWTES